MDQNLALKILKCGVNAFLTGEPGSGKTYLVNEYVSYLRSHGIKPAITASTGIAATHIGGVTIHSWSGIGIKNHLGSSELRKIASNDYIKKRIIKAKVLIIDEISMLPPETLQMVDTICREIKKVNLPFGGIQVILVGDFFQLPPVSKRALEKSDEYSQENLFEELPLRFAFDAPAFVAAEFVTCYLTEQHRQNDETLTNILSKIRSNTFDDLALQRIQARLIKDHHIPELAPKLFSHNCDVDIVNNQMLAKIPREAEFFPMHTKGHEQLINVMKKGCLSPEHLYLKIGAAVMFTKNNPKESYVNGTLGVVEAFSGEDNLPIVKTRDGKRIEVGYAEWAIEEDGKIKGRLSQLPLRLAWAITVHKSQGISLDEAVMDLSKVFEYGQGYVAISRVKKLEGVHLLGCNEMAFQVDPQILIKDKEFFKQSLMAEKLYNRLSEQELTAMFDEFLIRIGGELDITKVAPDKKDKTSTIDETLKLWKTGMDIAKIAKERGLGFKTVFGHIEKLVLVNKISKEELLEASDRRFLEKLPIITKAFNRLGNAKLTPVFEYFKGKFSYDELKLAKLIMSSQ